MIEREQQVQPTYNWLTRVAWTSEMILSVAIFYALFLFLKLALVIVDSVGNALWKIPICRLLGRRPLLTSACSAIFILLLASPIGTFLSVRTNGGSVLRLGMSLVFLALLLRSGSMALNPPSSLSIIRERAHTEPMERWFASRMKKAVDSVWPRFVLALTILGIPAIVGIMHPTLNIALTATLYGMVLAVGGDTINAFEHANGHYRFFASRSLDGWSARMIFRVLDVYCEYILPLLFARVPHWYKIQHVVVHHAEDNGEDDTQSTLPYDRASFIDFARCANRFAVSSLLSIDVMIYLVRKGRKRALLTLWRGMSIFYLFLGLMTFWNWRFVLIVIAFRYAEAIKAALGFFQEHGMVDISAPQNIYRNSLHYIVSTNSHGSLGDDVHIEHHLHQGRHWSSYIDDAQGNFGHYAAEKSLGFLDGPGCLKKYYRLIWRRDFRQLARHFVIFGQPEATTEEVAALLWARTRPSSATLRSRALDRVDCALGLAAGYLLL